MNKKYKVNNCAAGADIYHGRWLRPEFHRFFLLSGILSVFPELFVLLLWLQVVIVLRWCQEKREIFWRGTMGENQGRTESAGINRHRVGDERALHKRRSCSIKAPSHASAIREEAAKRWQGKCRPAIELRNHLIRGADHVVW